MSYELGVILLQLLTCKQKKLGVKSYDLLPSTPNL